MIAKIKIVKLKAEAEIAEMQIDRLKAETTKTQVQEQTSRHSLNQLIK